MQKYLDTLDSATATSGGGIDQFWVAAICGSIRCSSRFPRPLRRGVLPVEKRSQQLVCDILPVTKAATPSFAPRPA